jgi:hypothetical protein
MICCNVETPTLMRDSFICELETESKGTDKKEVLTGGVNGFTSHDLM